METREQLEHLKKLSCDEYQGYLFSKPVPAAEFARLLAQNRVDDQLAPRRKGAGAEKTKRSASRR
ncbi:hypothetical protein D3C83_188280 [compost metagenome]